MWSQVRWSHKFLEQHVAPMRGLSLHPDLEKKLADRGGFSSSPSPFSSSSSSFPSSGSRVESMMLEMRSTSALGLRGHLAESTSYSSSFSGGSGGSSLPQVLPADTLLGTRLLDLLDAPAVMLGRLAEQKRAFSSSSENDIDRTTGGWSKGNTNTMLAEAERKKRRALEEAVDAHASALLCMSLAVTCAALAVGRVVALNRVAARKKIGRSESTSSLLSFPPQQRQFFLPAPAHSPFVVDTSDLERDVEMLISACNEDIPLTQTGISRPSFYLGLPRSSPAHDEIAERRLCLVASQATRLCAKAERLSGTLHAAVEQDATKEANPALSVIASVAASVAALYPAVVVTPVSMAAGAAAAGAFPPPPPPPPPPPSAPFTSAIMGVFTLRLQRHGATIMSNMSLAQVVHLKDVCESIISAEKKKNADVAMRLAARRRGDGGVRGNEDEEEDDKKAGGARRSGGGASDPTAPPVGEDRGAKNNPFGPAQRPSAPPPTLPTGLWGGTNSAAAGGGGGGASSSSSSWAAAAAAQANKDPVGGGGGAGAVPSRRPRAFFSRGTGEFASSSPSTTSNSSSSLTSSWAAAMAARGAMGDDAGKGREGGPAAAGGGTKSDAAPTYDPFVLAFGSEIAATLNFASPEKGQNSARGAPSSSSSSSGWPPSASARPSAARLPIATALPSDLAFLERKYAEALRKIDECAAEEEKAMTLAFSEGAGATTTSSSSGGGVGGGSSIPSASAARARAEAIERAALAARQRARMAELAEVVAKKIAEMKEEEGEDDVLHDDDEDDDEDEDEGGAAPRFHPGAAPPPRS